MNNAMVRIMIDFENPATEWWEGGGRDLWESIVEGFENNGVLLERAIAESWIAHASQLPGWEGGPDHSPHPIRVVEIDEDEVL
jgi:hypothetical protein